MPREVKRLAGGHTAGRGGAGVGTLSPWPPCSEAFLRPASPSRSVQSSGWSQVHLSLICDLLTMARSDPTPDSPFPPSWPSPSEHLGPQLLRAAGGLPGKKLELASVILYLPPDDRGGSIFCTIK